MKRLEILLNSLKKKEELFELAEYNRAVLAVDFHRLGMCDIKKYRKKLKAEKKALYDLQTTKNAIKQEEEILKRVEQAKGAFPKVIINLIENKTIKQWRKRENVFFVDGVNYASIIYEKGMVKPRYYERLQVLGEIDMIQKYCDVFNYIKNNL